MSNNGDRSDPILGTEAPLGGIPSDSWDEADGHYRSRDLSLHYIDIFRRQNPDDGRPVVVMLHGMTSHADSWKPTISSMASPRRVLCPDLRGHGLSDWSRDGYWLADYAADVLTLLDKIDEPEFDLVGASLGARVAMVLAPMLGERLRSLTLCDTGPEVSRSAAEQALSINASNQAAAGFRDQTRLRAFLHEQQPEWLEVAIDVRARRLYRENWAGMLVSRCDPEVTWLLGRAGLKEVDEMWAGLRSTRAPTLIVRATRSFLLDAELTERMTGALASPATVEIDAGHYLPYEVPDALASTLDDFLSDPAGFRA